MFNVSKLWKAKFFLLYDVIFLARLELPPQAFVLPLSTAIHLHFGE